MVRLEHSSDESNPEGSHPQAPPISADRQTNGHAPLPASAPRTDEEPREGQSHHQDQKPDDSAQAENQRAPSDEDAKSDSQENSAPRRDPAKPPWYKRPLVIAVVCVVIVAIVVAGVLFWLHKRHFESTDDAFIDGHTVQIAPKVAGFVSKLLVTDNQLVNEGELLLEIDPRDYTLALDRARTNRASAQAKVFEAESEVAMSEAQVEAAKADYKAAAAIAENGRTQMERNQRLAPKAVSQETLDSSVAQSRSATAQESAARAKITQSEAQLRQSQAQLATARVTLQDAEVQIQQAELNESYTRVVAPITGRVTHRRVEQGDYLQVGQALFALVDPNVWVTANFKETQLTHMRAGQNVEVRIDAYPHQKHRAHIDSFQRGSGAQFSILPPENATGNYVKVVQRVPVKIVFDESLPPEMMLGPGMSVEPTVRVR